ncbi:MAG: 1-acyl-sn-glycerol-3-phosphate acyltransferase [Gammaproteobacteria bacterium]|nr:1-acyl-sn-glycerol-3-phosphate acyltransferase [Gammaproteobacteria bacterium]
MALENLAASALCVFAKLLTGVRAVWRGSVPDARQRVYFANHRSHGDFVLIWASLPPSLRRRTRPVAGADYWRASALRRYIADRVFRGVLIGRKPSRHQANPVELMGAALADGDSLIIFPEGTRNLGDTLLPFKSGIYHLAKAHPEIELVPVWIENLGRVMPKGTFVPAPLLCSLTFGQALNLTLGEARDDFLIRARESLLTLAPPAE